MTTKELKTRDPEAIRKDLLIAQLKGANVQPVGDGWEKKAASAARVAGPPCSIQRP
jgi:hypothetical protein